MDKWLLVDPRVTGGLLGGDGPPFGALEVDMRSKTGSTLYGFQSAPLSDVVFAGPLAFGAQYNFRGKSGMFRAQILDDFSLALNFYTGSVILECTAKLVTRSQDTPESSVAPKEIHCAADVAHGFDSLVAENNGELQQWCRDQISKHPDAWFAVGLAKTAVDVPVTLGQGTVDALKLGEGCVEGGWGYAKDALRLLQFVPLFRFLPRGSTTGVRTAARELTGTRSAVAPGASAVGADASAAKSAAPVVRRIAPVPPPMPPPRPVVPKLDVNPRVGICTWVASCHAIRLVKTMSYMSVPKLMKLACLDNVPIRSVYISELVPTFQRLGIRVTSIFRVQAIPTAAEKVVELAQKCKGVVLFTVRWADGEGHSLVASYDATVGRVRILDRMGVAVEKIADLERYYPGISTTVLEDAYWLEEARVTLVSQAGKIVPMIGVVATLALHAVSNDEPAQSSSPAPTVR
jgi:hypothetical protein